MNPLVLIKFIGCWFCIVSAVVLLVLGHQLFGLPGVLALLAIGVGTVADKLDMRFLRIWFTRDVSLCDPQSRSSFFLCLSF